MIFILFFQAEDGIRDRTVTGVQTCALPICRCAAAADGEVGLAAAAAHRPDLILMDIQLPILDGYEATRRLKADAALRVIPVIAVTSYGLAGDADKARAAGCDD